jgi:hypothetical protein
MTLREGRCEGRRRALTNRPQTQWLAFLKLCLAAIAIGVLLALAVIGGEFGDGRSWP